MIEISYSNGSFLVWDVEDVRRLRAEHRIVGNLVGCLPSLPRQDHMLGLPMELMNEEVVLLLTQGLAKLVEFKELSYPAEPENKRKREEIHSSSFIEQAKLFKEERTTQLLKIADKIIEGKRKKAKGSFDEAVAIQEEIAKIPEMTEESMMVQIFTRPHWACQGKEISQDQKLQLTLKCKVFADLWKKGYYLTAGHKFGGDFLVYPGDPFKFHSSFIAVCIEQDKLFSPHFLIQKGRLGTSVKKTVLLCSVDQSDDVQYQSLNWNGK